MVEVAVFAVLGGIGALVWFFGFREEIKPNVILISIDTLRADHLGCYGYPQDTTPNLDRLAAEGMRFDRVHSTTSWTLPAHVSLMTGLPNELHDVRHDTIRLDPAREMLAEQFKRAGYKTAGFFGGTYLGEDYGFAQGFDRYENCGAPSAKQLKELGRNPLEAEFEAESLSHRVITAEKIENKAEAFLRNAGEDPFFLFLHHWDVHYDYRAPSEYVRLFAPNYRGSLDPSAFMANPKIAPDMSAEDLAWVIAHYDAEIRWVDFQIGRLLETLDELGLRENTYVVVTADHGEEFFEHGNKGHRKTLYEESLRIPLIIAGPGINAGDTRNQARIFDIMPTILDLCGLPAGSECYGVSLAPLTRGKNPDHLRELRTVAELTDIPLVPNDEGTVDAADHYFQLDAVTMGDHKRIEWRRRDFREERLDGEIQDDRTHLFDLSKDPGETKNLANEAPDIAARLRTERGGLVLGMQQFKQFLQSSLSGEARFREFSAEDIELMKQNGYIGQGDPEDANPDALLPQRPGGGP